MRHVGLAEAIAMIADAMGWKLDKVTDEIVPKIAAGRELESTSSPFDPGYVCGLIQDGIGYVEGKPVITLHMEAYLGAPESYDAVEIVKGTPSLARRSPAACTATSRRRRSPSTRSRR